MLHPLEQKLAALRRQAKPMAALRGLCITATVLAGAMLALGTLDYLVRLQDRGVRLIATLVVLGVWGWSLYRHVFAAFRPRLGNAELAALVERRFPVLGDRLQSAVEFLRTADDEATAGSVVLRQTVVAQATAEADPLDFSAVLDRRPTIRAGVAMTASIIVILLLGFFSPAVMRTGFVRLANPFNDSPWPRSTHLLIRRPVERVARGQDFEIEAVDARGARLPPDVRVEYRLEGPDGVTVEETERMLYVDGAMVARRENVTRPFSYRIEGGDDRSMPWLDVEVVEPPAVESVSILLEPPAYTGWPARLSTRHIRAPVGTVAQLEGVATKPLESARFCLEGGRQIAARLSDDGVEFQVEFTVERSGVYWFHLIDREGFSSNGNGNDRWEIVAVSDAAPSVVVERPTANLFVTPQAIAPVRVSAKDDFAIADVSLVFRASEASPESRLSLYAGPKSAPHQSTWDAPGESRSVDYRWNMSPLNLKPGTQVTFYVVASDYRPQTGKSESRLLIVVTPDELRDRIADREQIIVAELDRALKMQLACREQVESLRIRLGQSRWIERSDVDRMQAAEHSQREVAQLLAPLGDGVPVHAAALVADLENNGLDNTDTQRRIESLVAELGRLDRDVAPPLGSDLTAAVKAAQVARENRDESAATADGIARVLTAASERQQTISAAIQRQIDELTRRDGYRRLHREIAELLRDQEEAKVRTLEVGRRTLTREPRDLSSQDAADLHAAAARQRELARWLDRAIQEAARANAELRAADPAAADLVAAALKDTQRLGISGQMRDAGDRIERNQIGQAAMAQKQIAQNLQDVLDSLADQRRQDAGELSAEQLAKLEGNVKQLRSRQQERLEEAVRLDGIERSEGGLSRSQALAVRDLARMQRTLQADAARLGDRLVGCRAFRLALAGVAGDMRQAADAFERRQIGEPPQAAQRRAVRRLDLMATAMKPEKTSGAGKQDSNDGSANAPGKQAGQPGGVQTVAELKLLKFMQQEINLRTEALQQSLADGALTDQQRREFADLSEQQERLAEIVSESLQSGEPQEEQNQQPKIKAISFQNDGEQQWKRELGAAAEKESDNPMDEIARRMRENQQRLARHDSGAGTQQLERQIVDDLDRLIESAGKQSAVQSRPGTSKSQANSREPTDPSKKGSPGGNKPGGKSAAANTPRPSGENAVGKPNAAETRAAIQQLWGTLPKRERERMMQSAVEEFTPKYELMIEDYFRRLSEEKARPE